MKIYKFTNFFNPLLPIAYKSARIDKNFDSKIKRDHQKISYERRDYESVEEKSLSQDMSRKITKKKFRHSNFFDPLLPIAYKSARQNFDSNIRRDHQKISYERCDYESVEEKSLSQAMSRKTMNKRIQALKG